MNDRFQEDGFTLLELLVVMVIIGLLVGYVGPKYFSQLEKSESGAAAAQMEALRQSLDQYRLNIGQYPTAEQGLQALNTAPSGESKWAGPYLSKAVPNDPWGRPYIYSPDSHDADYVLYTLGKDGKPGGTGADQDIGLPEK